MSGIGRLAGKTALITGGSKGIGKTTALKLAKEGANVVINYSSDAGPANEVVKVIGEDRALAIKADAGDVNDIEKMVQTTIERFQKIDILIPNAGVLYNKDLENTTERDFDVSMRLNVKGPYFLAQKAAPHMGENSHIIFISTSLCALSQVTPNYLIYLTTKGAIEQMVHVLNKDLGRKHIYVNAIAPGPTGTDLFYEGKSEQTLKAIAGYSPHNRIGTPEDIAENIAWLSGSRWIAGQIVRVNGGMT
ncbi:MAG: hypothetical protein Q9157_009118 [Trypethelium eluteriae]